MSFILKNDMNYFSVKIQFQKHLKLLIINILDIKNKSN